MRKKLILTTALASLAMAGAAQADVIFTLGNNPQPGEQNILFTMNQTGTTVTGDIDHTGVLADFTSTVDMLIVNSNGQAKIENAANPNKVTLTQLTITVPGHTFGDFIFNPLNGVGNATVTATDNFDHVFNYNLGNGNNYLTVTTANKESIAKLTVDVACLVTDPKCTSSNVGFLQFKQPRISDVIATGGGGGGGGVPEPAALSLLGVGLVGLGVAKWRKVV